MKKPRIIVENDVFTRTLDVILNPECSPERRDAFTDFFRHDLPNFAEWLVQLRSKCKSLYPAEVVFVNDTVELHRELATADAVVVESIAIGATELAIAPNLKAVQKYGFVLRNIDTEACTRHGVTVLSLRRRANMACAEQAMMMMLALAKRLPEVNKLTTVNRLRAAGFAPAMFDRRHTPSSNWARITGISMLHGATLGIIGFGEIGRELALRANAFGMRVLYSQRTRLDEAVEHELNVGHRELEALLAESDWIVPQLPATPSTHELLNRPQFERMKAGARLVNVSRAQVMARDAVIEALRSGRLGGFALDTLWNEPGTDDDELLSFPNVILTPHMAGSPRHNAAADFEELLAGLEGALAPSLNV